MTHSRATRLKISKARTGTHHMPETIEKIRQAMLERGLLVRAGLLPVYKHSKATRAKMKKAAKHRKFTKAARTALAEKRSSKKETTALRRIVSKL